MIFNSYFYNFLKPVSNFSFKSFKLNIFILTFLILIFLIIFLLLLSSIIFHRKKLKNNKNYFNENISIEIFIIFFIIFLNFFIFFYITIFIINNKFIKEKFFTVKIISYQWKWYFNYIFLNKNINYFSNISTSIFEIINKIKKNKNYILKVDKKLILPLNKNIRLILTSNDVIHSIFIPFLNFKQDLIPGFYKDKILKINKIGKYYGFCTELCGKNHTYMPLILKILKLKIFNKWFLSKFLEKFLKLNF